MMLKPGDQELGRLHQESSCKLVEEKPKNLTREKQRDGNFICHKLELLMLITQMKTVNLM